MTQLSHLWSRVYGRVGLLVVAAAYVVMASSLVQYLVARNMRRRMDLALSGGFLGVGLVVLGVVLVLVERASLAADAQDVARRTFLSELRARRGGAVVAGADAAVTLTAVPAIVLASANSYHRPDCLLVAGREGVEELVLGDAAHRGLSACRLCLKGIGA
jgi:hypothetical protein